MGSALITPVNGGKISTQQVKALCTFARYLTTRPMSLLLEQMEFASKAELLSEKQKLVEGVTPAKFAEFYGYYEFLKDEEYGNWSWSSKKDEAVVMASSGDVPQHLGLGESPWLEPMRRRMSEDSSPD